MVHFCKRIGEQGIQKIIGYSVRVHGKDGLSKVVVSDTTVQENNTTFPTDAKLAKKVIDACGQIASKEGVKQRQSYQRVSKQYLRDTHNGKHPKRRAKAGRAVKKLRTLGGRLVRELWRKLPESVLPQYGEELGFYERVLSQSRFDKDKIYSLHKPFTACIAKGKASHPYEFGNKVGLMMNPKSLVVVAVDAFEGNPHDSKTIEPLLDQMQSQFGYLPKEVVYDGGGRGSKQINGVTISTPAKP